MNIQKHTGHLFLKAIFALGIVSIVPVILLGWHILNINKRVLQNEILDTQRTLANRIAFLVSETVSRQALFISIFGDLHTNLDEHLPFIDQEDLEYLRHQNPSITHISVLNDKGRQLFYSSDTNSRFSYASELATILQTCVQQGKEYVGSVNRSNGHLYALLAFPLYQSHDNHKEIYGVLVAEVDLSDLGKALEKVYVENKSVAIIAADGDLIAYSNAPNGLALEIDNPLLKFIQQLGRAMQDKTSTTVRLSAQQTFLASQVRVPLLNWTVYVYQPDHTIRTLLMESTVYSIWDVLLILLVLMAFMGGVAYWVVRPIVRPVLRLQEVAIKFEQEDNYIPTEQELIIPDNEIGQLIQVFLHMARVLFERRYALLATQQELANINKELERRVEQRTAELQAATDKLVVSERLAAIGQMASIISHEIRNPLAVISNATRLIQTIQPPTQPKLIKQFAIIEAEIKQANGIIGEVLGFARNRDMILSTIDLNSYLHDLINFFPAPDNVHVVEALAMQTVRLKVDAEELKQALRNLLTNACESMPEGGRVTLSTRVGKQTVGIYIADEGPGISEELKEKIFSPFFTTKARGTGLGLAVVRKAISRHKGKLFLSSQQGKGTVFAVYLKIYKSLGDTRYG